MPVSPRRPNRAASLDPSPEEWNVLPVREGNDYVLEERGAEVSGEEGPEGLDEVEGKPGVEGREGGEEGEDDH